MCRHRNGDRAQNEREEELLSDERARAERGRDSVQVVVEGAVERGGDSVQEVVERAVGARERYAGTLRSGVHRSGGPPFPLADVRPATTFPPSRRPRSSSCPVCRHSAASGGRTAGVEQSKP
ncbi:hypothetical protein EJ110_NYTH25967 [Nymphaea thermarum]|nr:hypothetical protein EJ110_NYTH25967 [Nymphaea thermarum]